MIERAFINVCGAEVYPLCDRDAGWECVLPAHGADVDHADLDGTRWPVEALGPLFLG